MAKVNLSSFNQQMAKATQALDSLAADAHAEFVRQTPVRSGAARRSTRLQGNLIVADYNYSASLDGGSSSQAPGGMSAPTERYIQAEVTKRLKGL